MSVEQRIRGYIAPDEPGAGARSRALAAAAFALRAPAPRRRANGALALGAVAAVLVALAVALTPPGDAVAEWVRDLVERNEPTAGRAPALTALPAPGRLLVTGPGGAWVVQSSGSARRLGAYEDAAWSPRGLFVAVTRGRSLSAVEPDGSVRWTLARAERLAQPGWAPSGYRVAYRAGDAIRVVAGDGSGDRLLAAFAGAAAPVWKPTTTRHLLAYVARAGVVEVRDADTGRLAWRSSPGPSPADLEWVAGGRSLAVIRGDQLQLLAANGRIRRHERLPGSGIALASRPHRTDVAVSVAGRDGTGRVLLVRVRGSVRRRLTLLASPGAIGEVAFSPDGSTVLASRAGASEWVFLPADRNRGRARAVGGIGRQFDPRPDRPRGMPEVNGWAP
jgi:hypothetical protein